MGIIEKIIDWVVWALVVGSIFWMAYGTYDIINLMFIRG